MIMLACLNTKRRNKNLNTSLNPKTKMMTYLLKMIFQKISTCQMKIVFQIKVTVKFKLKKQSLKKILNLWKIKKSLKIYLLNKNS